MGCRTLTITVIGGSIAQIGSKWAPHPFPADLCFERCQAAKYKPCVITSTCATPEPAAKLQQLGKEQKGKADTTQGLSTDLWPAEAHQNLPLVSKGFNINVQLS